MIKPRIFAKLLICKVTEHVLVAAESCPFTGITYQYCERCTAMIPIEELA
jgi:hypothetical protein